MTSTPIAHFNHFDATVDADPADARRSATKLDYDFEVSMVKGSVYNPWTGSLDQVHLRSYRGKGNADGSLVGQPIHVRPGQTLRVRIDNRLPVCTDERIRTRRCFNDTNLHTHGLWVSPAGNSDNVLISIPPGKQFQYEYNIPADHPAGTFWYHPHRHGNTAVQVSSGMAGALIVQGDRLPTEKRPGDIDILLRDRIGKPWPERILLFQQMQYACEDEEGRIKSRRENNEAVRPWTCLPGEVGTIERFPELFTNLANWPGSGRFTSINGRVQPVLSEAKSGTFERWRMVHAGVREPIRFRIYRLADGAPGLHAVHGDKQADWIAQNCAGPRLPMWYVAMDGLTQSHVRKSEEVVLFPGDRIDVITYFGVAGRYCIVHEPRQSGPKGNQPRILALLKASPGHAEVPKPEGLLQEAMIQSAERALPGHQNALIRRKVIADLRNGLNLSSFTWHPPVHSSEITGRRNAIMDIQGPDEDVFLINGKSYDHGRIDHFLPLGGVEEWRVSAAGGGGHPLHMHVNPFQIVRIANKRGEDVADPSKAAYDPDYAGLVGQWRDGIFVKDGYEAVVRTRYERFIGDFVIHCHILRHGDSGMMQNMRIYVPGSFQDPSVHH